MRQAYRYMAFEKLYALRIHPPQSARSHARPRRLAGRNIVDRRGRRAMELNQVSYFINLAETLNFTAAARLSSISQPSLTRAIRRLEEELGGPLIYRDGKNRRLNSLGQRTQERRVGQGGVSTGRYGG